MLFAKFIGMVIFFLPALIIATVAHRLVAGMLTPLAETVGWSTFEVAIALLIPYIILVYCAIVSPIVNFWSSLQNRSMPQGGGDSD